MLDDRFCAGHNAGTKNAYGYGAAIPKAHRLACVIIVRRKATFMEAEEGARRKSTLPPSKRE